MPIPTYYRPRMAVKLNVPLMGSSSDRQTQSQDSSTVSYTARVRRATLESNDHNTADALEVELDWNEAGTDPRLLTNAEVYFYMGNATERGDFRPGPDNFRFVGIVVELERHLSHSAKRVTIKAHDYTTLFIKSKPFPSTGVPDYTQTLRDAWGRICDNTGWWDLATKKIVSGVQALKDRIEFVGADPSVVLGKAVGDRFKKFGKVQVRPEDDAWAVWQRCVGSLGLISFIRRDKCIVTTATDYYTAKDPPRFIWGKNITDAFEKRDTNALSGKGVALTSFDSIRGTTIEAFWPPREAPGQTSKGGPSKKQIAASASKGAQAVVVKEYEFYAYPGVTDEGVLTECAKRAFEERSRQELQGGLRTVVMFTDTLGKQQFDLLNLAAGDRIRVELDEQLASEILRIPTETARIAFLKQRGYADGVAKLIVANVSGLARLLPEFQVRHTRVTLEINERNGTYDMEIGYVNRINVSGDALKSTQA